jgi:acyl-CoA dehydrogenase
MFAALMKFMKAKRMLPVISDTERLALEAGTVWIDGEFFKGNPDFARMLAEPYSRLAPEEQAFLDGPAEELCKMTDRYTIARTRRVPEHLVDYMKKQGFFGLLIPKEYGGKGFSVQLRSAVMAKVSPVSNVVGTYIVIPNSLGAAELLIHYGTEAQKQHYLPKLASGEYVPCFGLTEPTAGSDAASIKAEGLVFRDAAGQLQIRLNFRKRFITLAPLANLISIACQLKDPDNLLGKGAAPGITVVLVHKGTPGLTIGDHHEPIGDPFPNGPILGKDVVVPVDNIVGGAEYAGQGWRMLMEQLAGGRAISLPAGAIGGMKAVMAVTGAFSMVRQQFGMPIGRMEGVEEKVGKIAGLTYAFEGARVFACSALDNGQQPPVVSAVLKAYSTEIARELGKEGMDVFAGSGVMQGPNNILGKGYAGAPVAITVEGANIMTRTLIIFGQGATRCHPYAFEVVRALERDDVPAFRNNLLAWIGHFLLNSGRNFVRTLTRGWTFGAPVAGETATYYRRLGWASAKFAMLTDLAMFFIGGKLKARGKLTGRYADALAWQLIAFSALRRFEAEGRRAEDLPLVQYACDYALNQIQEAFEAIYANFDTVPLIGWYLRWIGALLMRVNPIALPVTDVVSHRAALCIDHFDAQYQRLVEGVFHAPETYPGAGRLMRAFRLVTEAHAAAERVILAQRKKQLTRGLLPAEVADEAVHAGIITAAEARLLKEALAARLEAIEVDVFTAEQFYAGGLQADVSLHRQDLPTKKAVNA